MMIDFKGHVPFLDGLRGIAVIMVFFFHCAPPQISSFFQFGWSGVDLFFVLSGFLITGILLDTKDSENYFKNFFARRFLRLFPLYYGILFVILYVLPMLGHAMNNTQDILDSQIYYWTYTQNILIALKGVPKFEGFMHFWSLAIEEQFYIFWPFIIRSLNKKKIIVLVVAGIGLSIILRNINPFTPFASMFTLCRTEGLLLGGLAAILIRNPGSISKSVIYTGLIVSILAIVCMWLYNGSANSNSLIFVRIGYTVTDFLCFFTLLFLFLRGKITSNLRELIANRILRLAGKYSYGIYVYHAILFWLLYNAQVTSFQSFFALSTITILISVLSYHLYEKPFLSLKKHFK